MSEHQFNSIHGPQFIPIMPNIKTVGSLSLILFPDKLSENLRISAFVDAGNVYTTYGGMTRGAGPLRFSTGFGLEWNVPMGFVVQASLAKAINPQTSDDEHYFQFTLGTGF